MAQDSRHLSKRHSLLNHSRPCRVSQAMKGQSFDASVLNAGEFTGFSETSLHVSLNAKNEIGLALDRHKLSFKFFERVHERRGNRDRSVGQSFRVGRYDVDLVTFNVNVLPLQFKNFPESHTRGQGADKDRLEMCARAEARSQQSPLFVIGQRSFPSPFVGHLYKRIVFFKRDTEQPSLFMRLSKHGANQHHFPVDAGNGPRPRGILFDYWSLQALLFVLLKLAMRQRSEFVGPELCLDSTEQIHLRLPGAPPLDDPTVTIDRLNQVSILIPLCQFGKSFLGMSDCAFIVFKFIERLLKILFCLRFILASPPNSMAFTIKSDVCCAGVDLPALFDNLQFPFAGHRVYTFVPEFGARFDFEDLEESPHGSLKAAYNQGIRLFLIVSGCVGPLAVVLLALIVDQEVVGSSPTSRPYHSDKTSRKSHTAKTQEVVPERSIHKSPFPKGSWMEEFRKSTQQTGILKLPNGRFRARYFAGYNAAGKRVYPARTFDTRSAALKWRSESVASRLVTKDAARSIAVRYTQGSVYSAPFAIPTALKPIRNDLIEIHLPFARICCVYFLVSSEDEVLYVGQTTDLHQRIRAHSLAGVKFSRALFIPVQAPDLIATEAHFIRALNPPLNKTLGSFGAAEPVSRVQDLVEHGRALRA